MEFNGLAAGIGSLPHPNAKSAVAAVFKYMQDCPFWPQLPAIGPQEGMTPQFSGNFPGIGPELESSTVDVGERGQLELGAFYEHVIGEDVEYFALPKARAQGFYAFEEALMAQGVPASAKFIKGHVTGPITLAAALKESDGKELTFNETFREAVANQLALNARWQIRHLGNFGLPVIIFLDEPVMEIFGSAYSPLTIEIVRELWGPVLETIRAEGAYSGIHCCGNTDWGVLLESGTDMVNFDAYHFLDKMVLYAAQAETFMEGGGALAWGIVPTDDKASDETAESLFARLEAGMARFEEQGVDAGLLRRQCVITPSCGMGSLSVELAEKIMELLLETSMLFKQRYPGGSPKNSP